MQDWSCYDPIKSFSIMNNEHVHWKIISEPRGIVSANVNNSNPSLSSIIHHCLPVALYLSHIWRPSTFWLSVNFHRKSVLLGTTPIIEDQICLDDQLLWEKSNENMKSVKSWLCCLIICLAHFGNLWTCNPPALPSGCSTSTYTLSLSLLI